MRGMTEPEPRLIRFEGFEGIHLVGDEWGDPDAYPVLLMHGGGQTRHAWGGTARTLAENGWRAVSIDLRGHGDSEWSLKGDYSFTAYSADCLAVSDALGRPPVLVGASLGGVAAMIAEGGSEKEMRLVSVSGDLAVLAVIAPESEQISEEIRVSRNGFDQRMRSSADRAVRKQLEQGLYVDAGRLATSG